MNDAVIEGARHKLGWETLGYVPNEAFVAEYLDKFPKLVECMTAENILEGSLNEWLSEAEENDPVRCGFPKCKIHDDDRTVGPRYIFERCPIAEFAKAHPRKTDDKGYWYND